MRYNEGCIAGLPAVHFFEETNPDIPRYGTSDSENDNPAEWIVNLTTQVSKFVHSFIMQA